MWDWLERSVTGAREETLGGTVSLNRNTSFGILSDSAEEPPQSDCEIRVSWTPVEEQDGGLNAGDQVDVWARFLKSMTANDELEEPISDRE
ncbi:permease [Bifidobacterium callimiconis]|uniref:Permease n=2 Tax=Bifidobacterium callimiconis TaxID=2306973 RepID=A0A430FDB0_9BIFI|nr:permease [Bifidobacterium callimiconis]